MKVEELGLDPRAPYQKMYAVLFNALTDAVMLLDEGKESMARRALMDAQRAAEELYIEGEEG